MNEVIDHLYIMSNEFDMVISLVSSLKEISENEISIEKIKQNIKDFANEVDKIIKIYSQNEQKIVEYLKAEKDFDYMSTENLMIGQLISEDSPTRWFFQNQGLKTIC